MSDQWKALSADPATLTDARLQLHYAAMLAAAPAQTYIPHRDDYTEGSMDWSPALDAMVSQEVDGKFRVALFPAELLLAVLEGDNRKAELKLEGRTMAEARAWLKDNTAAYVGEPKDLILPIEFYKEEMPEHDLGRGKPFSAAPEACAELAAYYHNAYNVIQATAGKREGAAPYRIWPHHFDGAILVSYGGEKSVNTGMSPGDGSFPEPYIYVSPWPYPAEDAAMPDLKGGHWHREGFTAAILKGSDIVKAADQQAAVREFIESAVSGGEKLLGK